MKQTPCEFMMWHGIPVIRREIARSIIENFDLNQKETAKKLGVTPAAISQYLSGKRGKLALENKEILLEIKHSAEIIIEHGESRIVSETCRICKIMRQKGILQFSCDACD